MLSLFLYSSEVPCSYHDCSWIIYLVFIKIKKLWDDLSRYNGDCNEDISENYFVLFLILNKIFCYILFTVLRIPKGNCLLKWLKCWNYYYNKINIRFNMISRTSFSHSAWWFFPKVLLMKFIYNFLCSWVRQWVWRKVLSEVN